jgi:hypothetical protein
VWKISAPLQLGKPRTNRPSLNFNAATGICEMASSRSVERSDTTGKRFIKNPVRLRRSRRKKLQQSSPCLGLRLNEVPSSSPVLDLALNFKSRKVLRWVAIQEIIPLPFFGRGTKGVGPLSILLPIDLSALVGCYTFRRPTSSHCPKMMWSRKTRCATCHQT